MDRIKKTISAVLTAVMVLTLSACAGKPAETSEAYTREQEASGASSGETAASGAFPGETSESAPESTQPDLTVREQFDGRAEGFRIRVGVGKCVITPEVGGWLQGYTPARKSLGVNDDLNMIFFAFEQDGELLLAGSSDTCNLGDRSDYLRNQVSLVTGVPFDHVIIAATHTHSGPSTYVSDAFSNYDPQYVYGIWVPAAIEAACEAIRDLQWAEMGIAVTESEVGINRRQTNDKGVVVLGQDKKGLFDPAMTVISFRNHEGKTIGNIVHYGAHNTASGQNTKITRDWCGVMKDKLEEISGGTTAFFNGAQGDVGPRLSNFKSTGNTQLMLDLGEKAAKDVEACYQTLDSWKRDIGLKVVTGKITVPYEETPVLQQLAGDIAALKRIEKRSEDQESQLKGLNKLLNLLNSHEPLDEALVIDTTVFSVGDFVFVASPFESFAEMVLKIREESPYPYTLVVSNCNGREGYFPTEEEYPRGGYEVRTRLEKAQQLVPDGTEYFVKDALVLIGRLTSAAENGSR